MLGVLLEVDVRELYGFGLNFAAIKIREAIYFP